MTRSISSKYSIRRFVFLLALLMSFGRLAFSEGSAGCDIEELRSLSSMDAFSFVLMHTIETKRGDEGSKMEMAYEFTALPPNYFRMRPRPDLIDKNMPIQYSVVSDGRVLWQQYQAGDKGDDYYSLAVSSEDAPNSYRELFSDSRLQNPRDLAPTMGYFRDLFRVLGEDVDLNRLMDYGGIVVDNGLCCFTADMSFFEGRTAQAIELCIDQDTHLLISLKVSTERAQGVVVQERSRLNAWSSKEMEEEFFSFEIPEDAEEVESIFEYIQERARLRQK